MIDKSILLKKLDKVEKLARGSILNRFLYHPFRYLNGVGYWRFIYPIKKKGKFVKAKTFFGADMKLVLPSATEIYLFGAKTHDSEIRLSRFLIQQLNQGDVFCDVGAHFGYFSLLAVHLVGEEGKVFSFEASKNTFSVFRKNANKFKNIFPENKAAADDNKEFIFHEYPVLYSEYNSLAKPDQNSIWIKKNPPVEIKISGQKLEDYFFEKNINPKIIKIDVEGAELQVIKGGEKYLKNNAPVLVMEYLVEEYQNKIHEQSVGYLKKLNYKSFIIDKKGHIKGVDNIYHSLQKRNLTSDNIVFIK